MEDEDQSSEMQDCKKDEYTSHHIVIDDCEIGWSKSIKYVGVCPDSKLNWKFLIDISEIRKVS